MNKLLSLSILLMLSNSTIWSAANRAIDQEEEADSDEEIVKECPICLDNYNTDTTTGTINCGCSNNTFHESCIQTWFDEQGDVKSCPMCKQQATTLNNRTLVAINHVASHITTTTPTRHGYAFTTTQLRLTTTQPHHGYAFTTTQPRHGYAFTTTHIRQHAGSSIFTTTANRNYANDRIFSTTQLRLTTTQIRQRTNDYMYTTTPNASTNDISWIQRIRNAFGL